MMESIVKRYRPRSLNSVPDSAIGRCDHRHDGFLLRRQL